MVSEARPGPARLALPLGLRLRGGPLSSAPWRSPFPPGAKALAGAWRARAAGALSAHTAASPVHEPGFREPSRSGPLSSSSSFSSSSSPSSCCGSSRPELALLPASLGSASPERTTTPPEREQPRSWTKSFSASPRTPTPSTPPPGAGSDSSPRLAAASTVGHRPERRWALGRGAVSVCLSVSAAGPMRDPEGEGSRCAPAVTPKSRSLTLPLSLSLIAGSRVSRPSAAAAALQPRGPNPLRSSPLPADFKKKKKMPGSSSRPAPGRRQIKPCLQSLRPQAPADAALPSSSSSNERFPVVTERPLVATV
ncbi:PREDICTED: putative protein TPRXL-like [Chrysochloris asiatica]|uniref:Uncharacterized protein n=1 Tax=Chrysochloris asiatica TaxID=185453 RepID=A0A9B0TAV5_CHRAS|nr:PREDICTED: putative protein TPRXL-like [Chrysochloris asiatica]